MNNNLPPFNPFFMMPFNNSNNLGYPNYLDNRINELENKIKELEKKIINIENQSKDINNENKTDMYML